MAIELVSATFSYDNTVDHAIEEVAEYVIIIFSNLNLKEFFQNDSLSSSSPIIIYHHHDCCSKN